jgi:HEAT repeat protein
MVRGEKSYARHAAWALGKIGAGAKDAVGPLVERLKDKDPNWRADAAEALGAIGSEAAVALPVLKELMGDSNAWVHASAAFALVRITGDAKTYFPALTKLWDEDPPPQQAFGLPARWHLCQLFQQLGPQAQPARDRLVDAMLDDTALSFFRMDVARALAPLDGDPAPIVRKLVGMLEQKTDSTAQKLDRATTIDLLGELGPKAKAAIPALRKLVDDDDNLVSEAAVRALEQIESK